MQNVNSYLSEVVSYGGLPTTRGEMILDLQEMAARLVPDDPQRQERIVASYLAGHAHS